MDKLILILGMCGFLQACFMCGSLLRMKDQGKFKELINGKNK